MLGSERVFELLQTRPDRQKTQAGAAGLPPLHRDDVRRRWTVAH